MNSEPFAKFADELAAEGDNLSASVICFVGSLHMNSDEASLAILSAFAQMLVVKDRTKPDRESEESEAIAEMMREL